MTAAAVFAPVESALPIGASVALRMSLSGPVAIVCIADGAARRLPVPMPPPTPAAVRIASSLRAAGHPAAATWRLIRCEVTDACEAGTIVTRLAEASVPVVMAVATDRDGAVDAAAGACSLWIHAEDSEDGHAVTAACAALLPGSVSLTLPKAGAASVLALAGIAAPPAWVEPIDRALVGESAGTRSEEAVPGG